MKTYCQLFYSKISGAPREWFQSREGRKLLAKMIRTIRAKDGREEARYFRNLIEVSVAVD